jgi:hypothetical protein
MWYFIFLLYNNPQIHIPIVTDGFTYPGLKGLVKERARK